MRLHLVRHGESTWNRAGIVQGQRMEIPLTDLGFQQAARIAQQLSKLPIAALWSSDQLRAVQTAQQIAIRHDLTPRMTSLLRELDLGELEGKKSSELTALPTPPGAHVSEVAWGGGESVEQLHRRMTRFLTELASAQLPDDEVVVVSHGDTLRVLLAVLDGRSHRDVAWQKIPNASDIIVDYPAHR